MIKPFEQPSKELKIFVIEDDALYRHALEFYLSKNEKFKILSFKTGEECLKHFRAQNPDIIILDYRLNEEQADAKDGIEVLKKLKHLSPDLPVLMLSGNDSIEVATSSIRHGAFDYVVKNESSFLKVQILLSKIIQMMKLKETEQKQNNFMNITAIFLTVYVVAVGSLYFLSPAMLPNIVLSVLVVLSVGVSLTVHRKKEKIS